MYHIKLKKLDCTSELEMDSNDLILYYILHESPANSKVLVIMWQFRQQYDLMIFQFPQADQKKICLGE